MSFTRVAVFFKWSSGATKRAFKVLQQQYGGGSKMKPAAYRRSLDDGGLLIVYGPVKPRLWTGQIWGEDSTSGTANDGVEDIAYGTIDDLYAAWAATDLQVKSFEDAAYWSCEWKGNWDVALEFDAKRRDAVVLVALEEK